MVPVAEGDSASCMAENVILYEKMVYYKITTVREALGFNQRGTGCPARTACPAAAKHAQRAQRAHLQRVLQCSCQPLDGPQGGNACMHAWGHEFQASCKPNNILTQVHPRRPPQPQPCPVPYNHLCNHPCILITHKFQPMITGFSTFSTYDNSRPAPRSPRAPDHHPTCPCVPVCNYLLTTPIIITSHVP
jgi:hypothetical protein